MKKRPAPSGDPPLRPYEVPDEPAVPLDIPQERDTFTVPGERMDREELRYVARPVALPPLHPSEMPSTVVIALDAPPDPRLDGPGWGTARPAPAIVPGKKKILRPWDT